jgi:hypothetical protein
MEFFFTKIHLSDAVPVAYSRIAKSGSVLCAYFSSAELLVSQCCCWNGVEGSKPGVIGRLADVAKLREGRHRDVARLRQQLADFRR